MALASVQDAIDYLKIEHDVDDDMLERDLASAIASVEGYIRRPITAEERTFVIEQPAEAVYRAIRVLHVPVYPVAAETSDIEALALTDNDATELVEGTDYRLDLRIGRITALSGSFGIWPYTIVATVGLSARSDYSTRVEPALNAAILDVMADRYQRRNPQASSETTGGGVSTSYNTEYGLPQRVCATLAPFVMARAP